MIIHVALRAVLALSLATLALWEAAIVGTAVMVGLAGKARYGALHWLIQNVSLVLTLAGVPVCAALAYLDASSLDRKTNLWVWPAGFNRIWGNDQDGVDPAWYAAANPTWGKDRREFMWTAIRNSAHNLATVWGVSGAGRPLWYRTWTIRGKQFYAKAGWLSNGFPCMSIGSGRGY